LSHYTNISTEPVAYLNDHPVKPCMKSGFCCTVAPCGFGEWNEDRSACKHLLPANDIGQRDCGRYDWIKANVPDYDIYPGFGTGCCMPMFNVMRNNIIKTIKEKNVTNDS